MISCCFFTGKRPLIDLFGLVFNPVTFKPKKNY